MIDYDALLWGPIYNVGFGVSAVLTPPIGDPVTVMVIDETAGIEVASGSGQNAIATVRPAAAVRVSELTAYNIARAEIRGGTLQMNGKCWRIEATLPKPVPNGGEANGELYLILIES